MTPCPREGRWIGGCRFEPRYDVSLPDNIQSISAVMAPISIEALKVRIYVRDVCIRCGKTIERGAE